MCRKDCGVDCYFRLQLPREISSFNGTQKEWKANTTTIYRAAQNNQCDQLDGLKSDLDNAQPPNVNISTQPTH